MVGLADKVAQPVGEKLPVSGGGNVAPGDAVQLPQRHSGTDGLFRQLIGSADQVVDGRVFF